MFKAEGKFAVTITEATLVEPRFKAQNPGEVIYFDIAIGVKSDDGQSGYFYSECSNRQGRGNFAQFTQLDLTLQALQKIGFNVDSYVKLSEQFVQDGDKISIPNLIGMRAEASVVPRTYEKDGKEHTIYEVKYLNAAGGGLRKLDFSALAAIDAAIGSAPAAAVPPPPAVPVSNPFRK